MITEATMLEEPEAAKENNTTTQTLEEMKEDMEMLGKWLNLSNP